MAGPFAFLVCLAGGALSCASGSASSDPQVDSGPPSDGAIPDATLDAQGDSPGQSSVDSTAPETTIGTDGGAGDADETGVDAPVDTGADANEDGGMDSGSTLDTGTIVDTGLPQAEAGLGSGPFMIANLSTGFVVDNSGGSSSSGNPVIQYNANGATNQAWSPVSVAGGAYLLINQKSSLALDVSGTSTDQATVTGSAAEQWTFFPAGTAGYYTITSGGGGGVLTSPSSTEGAQLAVSPGVGSPSQQWRLVPAQ
jgi:hypothetical protein